MRGYISEAPGNYLLFFGNNSIGRVVYPATNNYERSTIMKQLILFLMKITSSTKRREKLEIEQRLEAIKSL